MEKERGLVGRERERLRDLQTLKTEEVAWSQGKQVASRGGKGKNAFP